VQVLDKTKLSTACGPLYYYYYVLITVLEE
jgi:hypothetical protein